MLCFSDFCTNLVFVDAFSVLILGVDLVLILFLRCMIVMCMLSVMPSMVGCLLSDSG